MNASDRTIILNNEEIHIGELTRFGLNRQAARALIAASAAVLISEIEKYKGVLKAAEMVAAAQHELKIRG